MIFGSAFVVNVCAQSYNIIINHFVRHFTSLGHLLTPLNVKKLKINSFLTHFYILINNLFMSFSAAFYTFSPTLHNDLLFLIQLDIFFYYVSIW